MDFIYFLCNFVKLMARLSLNQRKLTADVKFHYDSDSFLLTKLPVVGMIYDRKW